MEVDSCNKLSPRSPIHRLSGTRKMQEPATLCFTWLLPQPRGRGVRSEGRIVDYPGEEEGSPGGVSGRWLLCNLGSSGKVGDPAGMYTRLMGLRWRQAQRSEGRFTELSTVRQARINGLHPYQRQSHRVRFNPLGRRTLQIASRFRCPDRYCAIRLRTSPGGNRRHQGHAAPS